MATLFLYYLKSYCPSPNKYVWRVGSKVIFSFIMLWGGGGKIFHGEGEGGYGKKWFFMTRGEGV